MTASSALIPGTEDKPGSFHYLDQTVRHSLYRNGKVLTRRDADGSDAGTEGMVLEKREMTIHDARLYTAEERRTIAKNGFELLNRPLADTGLDFFVHNAVTQKYYPECAEIVQDATGAAHVFGFDHNIRSAAGKEDGRRITGGQEVQEPAHVVHGDYTLTSGPERLRQLANPPSSNDTLRSILEEGQSLVASELADQALKVGGRFAIINVWRNITEEPVATHPLALCDAQSVYPEDLVVFEIHYQDRVGENYFSKHSPRHQWYYYPQMTRDEALLIKQWDSAGQLARSLGGQADASEKHTPCTFSFHSAFEDAATAPDAPDRWSIEVRCIVLYD